MSQKASGFERQAADQYMTPEWAVRACKVCGVEKPVTPENFAPDRKNLSPRCRKCDAAHTRERWKNDPRARELDKVSRDKRREKIRAYDRMRAKRDKEKKLIIIKRWIANNPERHKEMNREKSGRWWRANRAKVYAQNRAKDKRFKLATPAWLTKAQKMEIKDFYAKSNGKHVDHIVPIKGKNVCGLHVPWNLQHLDPVENIKKYNHYAE